MSPSAEQRRPPRKLAGQGLGQRRRLDGEVLDVAGVSRLLGVTEKCIRARVTRQLLPHRRWGSRIVFLRGDVMAFLSKLDGVSVDEALRNGAGRSESTT